MAIIDVEQIQNEYLKCLQDTSHTYMIPAYLKTYDATQRKEVPFQLFPRQRDLCSALGSDSNVITTKPRQAGITTTAGAFISCEIALADPESPITVLVIGNTIDLAMQMVTKIREFLFQLPLWFWDFELYKKDLESPINRKAALFKICNTKELILKNGCRVVARSSGPDASRGVGGVTWLIFDEAAFIENGKDVYASALPTVSTGGHVIMISTPNGKDQLYYETYRQAKAGTNNYLCVELKWYQDPRYNKFLEWVRKNADTGEYEIIKEPTIDTEGHIEYNQAHWDDMLRKGYSPRSPWYVTMCESFNNNSMKIAQELDVSFLGSDSSVVAPEFVEMQRAKNVREPDPRYKDPQLEETWVWKPPIEGHTYIMSVDNSRGDADDATALEIIDLNGIDDDGTPCIEQVLEYNGKIYGDAIGEIAYNYGMLYNQAFIVVEDIGGYGSATILTLIRLSYPNLYYDDPSLKNYTSQNEATTLAVTENGLPGFHSSSVRFQMLSSFADLVRTNQFKVRSVRVCNELDTWVYRNGRMDHKDGCHDDTLTCLAMGLFVVEFSIKRQRKNRNRDIAMLNAMINVNSRIRYNENGFGGKDEAQDHSPEKKKFVIPIVINNVTYNPKAKEAYNARKWLLK